MFNCIIRVDASFTMGSGHVMRCLTLADSLRIKNVTIDFVSRQLPGNMNDYIESKGYKVHKLPYDPKMLENRIDKKTIWSGECWQNDMQQTLAILKNISKQKEIEWLIIDHYGLDVQWEQAMRIYVRNIMVIDDLADRKHDCNLLLDQNLYLDMKMRYKDLIPEYCKTLLGPQYVLLRPEFYVAKQKAQVRDKQIKRILIFFGGSDPTNETNKALRAITLLNRTDITIDVIVGKINPHRDEIKQYCDQFLYINFYCQVENMADLMVRADLAIGAGGSATWERCYLGLPTLVVITADNQQEVSEATEINKAIINLGKFDQVTKEKIYEALISTIEDSLLRRNISENAFTLMGISTRGVDLIIEYMFG